MARWRRIRIAADSHSPRLADMIDWGSVAEMSKNRPRMMGLDGSFREYVAFFNGVDVGGRSEVLGQFGNWIATRSGQGGWNIAWPLLVLRDAGLNVNDANWHDLDSAGNSLAVLKLFELLEEFLSSRADSGEPGLYCYSGAAGLDRTVEASKAS